MKPGDSLAIRNYFLRGNSIEDTAWRFGVSTADVDTVLRWWLCRGVKL